MAYRGRGGGGAHGPQRSYASSLHEQDALVSTYEHLTSLPSPQDALLILRKIASLVKPIMRKRGWHVGTLAEFMPENPQLLGLNIDRGQKICIRLRYTHAPATFLPIEQCVDTMLHELSHIVHGPHDAKFHALWDELRSEHETLLFRGYTGEGFLTRGQRLGGGNMPPMSEIQRLARQSAENRRRSQAAGGQRGGVRLGGRRIMPGEDARKVIADAIERRNTIDRGCASGSAEAERLATQTALQPTRTQSGEDDANDRAIAEALLELMEEEEMEKLRAGDSSSGPGLVWDPKQGLYMAGDVQNASKSPTQNMTEEQQMEWAIRESMKALPSHPESTSGPKPPIPDYASKPHVHAAPEPDYASKPTTGTSTPRSAEPGSSPPAKRSRGPLPTPLQPTPINLAQDSPPPPTRPPALELPTPSPASATPEWACDVCTCLNPPAFLACQACNMERRSAAPKAKLKASSAAENLAHVQRQSAALRAPDTMGWSCRRCGTFVEHRYWTCTVCGLMKGDSRASEHVV